MLRCSKPAEPVLTPMWLAPYTEEHPSSQQPIPSHRQVLLTPLQTNLINNQGMCRTLCELAHPPPHTLPSPSFRCIGFHEALPVPAISTTTLASQTQQLVGGDAHRGTRQVKVGTHDRPDREGGVQRSGVHAHVSLQSLSLAFSCTDSRVGDEFQQPVEAQTRRP
jgi:hypothetical protein